MSLVESEYYDTTLTAVPFLRFFASISKLRALSSLFHYRKWRLHWTTFTYVEYHVIIISGVEHMYLTMIFLEEKHLYYLSNELKPLA